MSSFFRDIKEYVGFDEADSARLLEADALVSSEYRAIVDHFYDRILNHPQAHRAITGGAAQVERLKATLRMWLSSAFLGPHDDAYCEMRLRIGRAHVQINLPQQYMFTAMAVIREDVAAALKKGAAPATDLDLTLISFHKLMDLELAIMLHSYKQHSEDQLQSMQRLAGMGRVSESLISTVGSGIIALSVEGRVEEWNREAERIHGCSRTEAIGKDYLRDFLPLEEHVRVGQEFVQILAGTDVRGCENLVLGPDGAMRSLLWNATRLVDDEGEVTGFVMVGQDITERKSAQQAAARAQKMESIGMLAAGVAHEVNNPLAGLTACCTALRNRTVPEQKQEEYWHTIDDALNRIGKIVRGLTDYAQPRAQHATQVPVAEAVSACLNLVAPTLREKNVTIHTTIDESLSVYADRSHVMQALVNLVLNAVYELPEDGEIAFSACSKDGKVGLSVADNGRGIPEHLLQKVCDPFFTTKPAGQGTGLGLSITEGLVKSNGGVLEVRAQDEGGAEFMIWLPTEPGTT